MKASKNVKSQRKFMRHMSNCTPNWREYTYPVW